MRFIHKTATATCSRWVSLALLVLALAGCKVESYPDPNDPQTAGERQADVILTALNEEYASLARRAERNEIDPAMVTPLLAEEARELADKIDASNITADNAFKFGQIYRTAEMWPQAQAQYEAAVQHAKETGNQDRLVNDRLQLARVLAHQGKVEEAIRIARESFEAPPGDKGAILPAVLYEIVPPARGHGKDSELGSLLQDAIAQHMLVVVDPTTIPGQAFAAAKPSHIRRAWDAAISLYVSADDEPKARAAIAEAENMLGSFARI